MKTVCRIMFLCSCSWERTDGRRARGQGLMKTGAARGRKQNTSSACDRLEGFPLPPKEELQAKRRWRARVANEISLAELLLLPPAARPLASLARLSRGEEAAAAAGGPSDHFNVPPTHGSFQRRLKATAKVARIRKSFRLKYHQEKQNEACSMI